MTLLKEAINDRFMVKIWQDDRIPHLYGPLLELRKQGRLTDVEALLEVFKIPPYAPSGGGR